MITHKHSLKPLVGLAVMAAALSVLGGCLEGSAIRTGPYYTPKSPGALIDVYTNTVPAQPYIEVGIVSAQGSGYHAYSSDVLPVLKDEAGSLGADAVIVTDTWYTTVEYYDEYDDEIYSEDTLHMEGTAIVYVD